MALFITLDNVYRLYDLDATRKIDGIVVFHQYHKPNQDYTKHSRLFEGLLLGVVLKGSMKTQIHFTEYEVKEGDIAVLVGNVSRINGLFDIKSHVFHSITQYFYIGVLSFQSH